MKAIVLAAGLGKRLRPITLTTPKPLVRVGGKPLIDWALDQLQAEGISEVVVNTSYLYEQVEAHVAQRMHPAISLSRELPEPLETGGGIKQALPLLGGEPFLVLNSDTICLDGPDATAISRLRGAWDADLDFLMLVQPLERAVGFYGSGDFVVDAQGYVRRPEEGENAPYVFTGIEIIHPRVFEGSPDGAFSLNRLWDHLKGEDGWFRRIRAVVHDGDWLHVGDARGLREVEAYLRKL